MKRERQALLYDHMCLQLAIVAVCTMAEEQFLGLALVIANDYTTTSGFDPLPGTHTDARALRHALESLQFKVAVKNNISASDCAVEIDRLASSSVPPCCRYVLFAFCGHGNEHALFAQDGKELPMGGLVEKFYEDQMNLTGKIRLLFIDACRGTRKDSGVVVTVDSRGGKLPWQRLLPVGSNMVVAFSTLPGFVSQEVKDGPVSKSVWMPILAEELANTNDSIHVVLTTVNRKMIDYSNELKKMNPLVFPQSHYVVNTLFSPCNIYHDAQIFSQWLSANSPAAVQAPAMRGDRVGDTPHRYYLRSQNRPREPTANVTRSMQNMHI